MSEMALQAREISSASGLSSCNSPLVYSYVQRTLAILMSPAPAKDKSQWISKFSPPKISSTVGKQLRSAAHEANIASSNWRNSTPSSTTSSSCSTSSATAVPRAYRLRHPACQLRVGELVAPHRPNTRICIHVDTARPSPANVKCECYYLNVPCCN
jgi:hypothetical protein